MLLLASCFTMFYLDGRLGIMLLQDWKIALNFWAYVLMFVFTGIYRTMAILRFGLNNNGKGRLNTAEDMEYIEPRQSWKPILILYEVAQAMNLFQTIMFWAFWHEDVVFWYAWKQPLTPRNVVMRQVMAYINNVIPPLIMLFDLTFSKLVFCFTHVWIHFFVFVVFWAINQGSDNLIGSEPTIYGNNIFPNKMIDSDNAGVVVGLFIGFLLCHILLTLFTKIKYWIFKNKGIDPLQPDHFEKRIEDYVVSEEKAIVDNMWTIDSQKVGVEEEDKEGIRIGEAQFFREIV